LHKKAFKAEGIAKETQPKKMAMHPRKLGPNYPKKSRPRRYFNVHHFLDALTIAKGMHEATNTTYPLTQKDVLTKPIKLGSLLDASMHIADQGQGPNHPLILTFQPQLNRLRQYRMLRPKRYYCARHSISSKGKFILLDHTSSSAFPQL
jgi:hypothetical protein